ELTQLYEAYCQERYLSLEELPIQYADYAVWQRDWLHGELLGKQLRYWKERLDGAEPISLPTDRPRPAVASYLGARESFILSQSASGKLKQLSQNHGATPFMTLLAGFQVLLSRYSGQRDIVVGTPIA